MIKLGKRLEDIKPSPTLVLAEKASALKEAGRDILNLTVGEPDFPTPPFACQGAVDAIWAGQTKYTATGGTAALKQAIAQRVEETYGIAYQNKEIIVSAGGKQVLFNALMATLNPGDEVIIPAPYWVSYVDMVLLAGGKPVIVPCGEEVDFKITPALLKAAITPRTKWLILNSPNNPTGQVHGREELQGLIQVLENAPHVAIISDDIYDKIVFGQNGFHSIVQLAPHFRSRTLIVNGHSKAYSMTGWRLGYGLGPSPLIGAMTDIQSHSTSNPSSISQAAGLAALKGPQAFLREHVAAFKERHDFMVAALNAMDGIRVKAAAGAFYLYPSCGGLLGLKTQGGHVLLNDNDVAQYFLEDAGVAVVPGSAFGMEPYFRLSYAVPLETLVDAAQRLRTSINRLIGPA